MQLARSTERPPRQDKPIPDQPTMRIHRLTVLGRPINHYQAHRHEPPAQHSWQSSGTRQAWAESQGIEVSARGRVPADLVARFQEANT
jgi:hypothetical protein